jgi:hypothetical protein
MPVGDPRCARKNDDRQNDRSGDKELERGGSLPNGSFNRGCAYIRIGG